MPKRTRVLITILLALVGSVLAWHFWPQGVGHRPVATVQPPLAGLNAVTNLQVSRDADGRWFASFDYFYTGDPLAATVTADAAGGEVAPMPRYGGGVHKAQRGQQHVRLEVTRPRDPVDAMRSLLVVAELRAPNGTKLVDKQVEQAIDWPDESTWLVYRDVATSPADVVLAKAVQLIDQGDSDAARTARGLLERLVARDGRFEPAYIELARVAMKTQSWPDGLLQARRLLDSALQIRPDSTDGKILMGYVQTHLGDHKRAQTLFSEAAAAGSSNLWLWANWAELQTLQGQFGPAIENYRKVLSHPPRGDRNDRPRLDAYERLLALLQRRGDIDGMQALFQQRYQESGARSCYGVDYARFLLYERGDTERATALAGAVVDPRCAETTAKRVLGLARYLEWSRTTSSADGAALLNQAQILLPMGPTALRELARGERTTAAIPRLVAMGERVDQVDGRKYNALGYALMERDHAAARRLLRLGAKPTATVGEPGAPVALIPIMSSDADGVRLMLQAGVDYASVRYEGTSALEIARQIGDAAVLKALRRASVSS